MLISFLLAFTTSSPPRPPQLLDWRDQMRRSSNANTDDHAYYRRELRERMLELSRYRQRMRRLAGAGAGIAGIAGDPALGLGLGLSGVGVGGFHPPGSTAGASAIVDQQERMTR